MDGGRAFLTGSYAYGRPDADSDIDLVVLVTDKELDLLNNMATEPAPHDLEYIAAGGHPIRFGRLNLLCCTHQKAFDIWWQGTKELKRRAPVDRDVAVEHFRRLREKAGYTVGPPALAKSDSDEVIPF